MYSSPALMAKIVIGALVLVLLADVLSLVATVNELSLLTAIRDGEPWTYAELDASDESVAGSALLFLGTVFLAAIAFLTWLYRIRKNEIHMGNQGAQFSTCWSVACWFIPIVNLFRPYNVMTEAWRASDPSATPTTWKEAPISPLLGWWWALWLLSILLDRIVRALIREETLDSYIQADYAALGSSLSSALAALLAIAIVRGLSARQDNLYRSRQLQLPLIDSPVQDSGNQHTP